MEKLALHLFKARDAEEAYAIRAPNDERWLARSGFGSQFEPVWTLELQSDGAADQRAVDWDQVLERAVEAYRLSDPVLTNFQWPTAIT
jgi:hypothetical protein